MVFDTYLEHEQQLHRVAIESVSARENRSSNIRFGDICDAQQYSAASGHFDSLGHSADSRQSIPAVPLAEAVSCTPPYGESSSHTTLETGRCNSFVPETQQFSTTAEESGQPSPQMESVDLLRLKTVTEASHPADQYEIANEAVRTHCSVEVVSAVPPINEDPAERPGDEGADEDIHGVALPPAETGIVDLTRHTTATLNERNVSTDPVTLPVSSFANANSATCDFSESSSCDSSSIDRATSGTQQQLWGFSQADTCGFLEYQVSQSSAS